MLPRGFAKNFFLQKSEITIEVGGWVQVSLGTFFYGQSFQNSPNPVLILWSSRPCVFCLYYTLLKVVGYYDFSVLSMSVMGFQKKSLGGGWVGGVSSIQFFFWNFFNFAKPLSRPTDIFVIYKSSVTIFISCCIETRRQLPFRNHLLLFRLSVSGCYCLDGSFIHQPLF